MHRLLTFRVTLAWIVMGLLHAQAQVPQCEGTRRTSRRVGVRSRAHTRRISARRGSGCRLRGAGPRGDPRRRTHLPARRFARTDDERRAGLSRAARSILRQAAGWLAVDFTLAEIKQLDAGSWFDPKYAGERIPTFAEAVDVVGTAAGLYPELKTPALYTSRGIDMTELFVESLRRLT